MQGAYKINRRLKLLAIVVAIAYAGIGLSPLQDSIGRCSPSVASLFAPPFFNFNAIYEDGSVLEFRVGMSRADVFTMLSERYADRADLTVNCVVTTADSVIPITKGMNIADAYGGGPRLCVRLDSLRLVAEFEFQDDAVSRIGISYIRSESL